MSDIVDRLMICAAFDPDQKEAAEEITRLRAELAAERKVKTIYYDEWQDANNANDALRALLRDARGFVGYFEMTPAQHVAQKSIELGKKIDAALKGDGA